MSTAFARALTVAAITVLLPGCRRAATKVFVYVTNEDSGTMTVIDANSDHVVATISVGMRPRGVRSAPDGSRVFVATSGSPKSPPGASDAGIRKRDGAADGIAVVDPATSTVLNVLPAGLDPEAFDVDRAGRTVWVSNEESAGLSSVDIGAHAITRTVTVGGEPEGVALSPDGRFVWVTSEAASEVDVVSVDSGVVVARVPTGARPRAVVFDRSGTQAFVTSEIGGFLHIIDAATHAVVGQVRTAPVGGRAMGIALSPDGVHAYVTNGREGSVAVIDIPSRKLERNIPAVGTRPWGIAITPDGKKLYVAALPDVAVIDIARGAVTKRITAGAGPWGVAIAERP